MTPQIRVPIQIDAAYRPDPSVRPIEIATAIALVMLAMALRWAPPRAGGGSAWQQSVISSAEWATGARRLTLRQVLGAVLAGCAVGLFIGGAGGLFCGLVTTIGILASGSRRISQSEKRSRLQLVAAAPPVVDLFAAGLAAGLLPADAAAATAAAFSPPNPATAFSPANPATAFSPANPTTAFTPQISVTGFSPSEAATALTPISAATSKHGDPERTNTEPHTPRSDRLHRFHPKRLSPRMNRPTDRPLEPTLEIAKRFADAAQALRRGADPEAAWRPLAVDGSTASVAAAALRASRTGAPASETVTKAARDLWSAAEHAAQAQVRSAAVRATVPLALCFLPAFILLGIVPTMIGILAELRA